MTEAEDVDRARRIDAISNQVRDYLATAERENAARRFGRQVSNGFARGLGWGLARRFLNALLGRG